MIFLLQPLHIYIAIHLSNDCDGGLFKRARETLHFHMYFPFSPRSHNRLQTLGYSCESHTDAHALRKHTHSSGAWRQEPGKTALLEAPAGVCVGSTQNVRLLLEREDKKQRKEEDDGQQQLIGQRALLWWRPNERRRTRREKQGGGGWGGELKKAVLKGRCLPRDTLLRCVYSHRSSLKHLLIAATVRLCLLLAPDRNLCQH